MNANTAKSYNILIVEDELEIAQIMKSYLELYPGFTNTVIAESSVQAMQKLSNQDFDLIITDIMLKRSDGLTFIETIRRMPKHHKQKMMVVSGCLTTEITLELMKKNIRHIVVKPFTARQILIKVLTCLKAEANPQEYVESILKDITFKLEKEREILEKHQAEKELSQILNDSEENEK